MRYSKKLTGRYSAPSDRTAGGKPCNLSRKNKREFSNEAEESVGPGRADVVKPPPRKRVAAK